MLMMRMGRNLRMVGRIIVTKDALPLTDVGIGVMHADRVAQLGVDHLVEVKIRVVPEKDPAPDQPVVIIRSQARDRFLDRAHMDILPGSAFDGGKVVVNGHAGVNSVRCMN